MKRFLAALSCLGLALALSTAEAKAEVGLAVAQHLQALWGEEVGVVPATPGLLLLEMARQSELAARVLARAGSAQRALSDSLLSTLELSEAQAVRALPDLFVVRDDSPPVGHRPPGWPQLRWQGVALLERIALDASQGRDLRLTRALAERRELVSRWTPSEIAGLVVLCSEWWADRGDDAAFYLDPQQLPRVDAWLQALVSTATLWEFLPRLHDDALRRRMLLERLSMPEHAFLTGECMEVLGSYGADFVARGFPSRGWEAGKGRVVGYDEVDLRAVALALLPRVSPHVPSGVEEHEQIREAFRWWRRARFEARYYRDARQATPPVLPTVLWSAQAVDAGGLPMHEWLKEFYVHDELRDLALDEVGARQAPFVAELMTWLEFSEEEARAQGFLFAQRRFPLRPDPTAKGIMTAIPWESVRELIREILVRATGHELIAAEQLDAAQAEAQWRVWWNASRRDPRWYRDPSQVESQSPRFSPERSRASG